MQIHEAMTKEDNNLSETEKSQKMQTKTEDFFGSYLFNESDDIKTYVL